MRNLISTCQLIILVVIAVVIMREVKGAEANRQARFKLLQTLTELQADPPTTFCVIPPPLPTT